MNRLIFEGRLLVNMTGSIIRQDDLRPIHGRLDWERMYRTADYHRIANIIYLGILGNGERIPERWSERFFERYQESLRYSDVCVNAENEILTLLDMQELSCTILASCGIRSLYQVAETAANTPLRLYFDLESYTLAKGYLVDLGYETDRIYTGAGERMRRVSGFFVEIYYKFPFKTRLYAKQALNMVEHANIRNTYRHIRVLPLEDRFVLRLAEAIYHYVSDELLIREILDIFLYYKSWREQMNEEYILKKLSDFNIDGLAQKLMQMACMWFGSKEDITLGERSEDMGVYDVLENRILSRGVISKETDTQAICLQRLIHQAENKEKHKQRIERIKKKIGKYWDAYMRRVRWIFPEYKYMCAIYPLLDKLPFLLPFCWIRRDIRLLVGMILDSSSKHP